jgi:DNA modification methylase
MNYQDFLSNKLSKVTPSGFDIALNDLPDCLFDYQKFVVQLALQKGKFAIFAGTGLGKSLMQLVWALEVNRHTNRPVLILAPLAVAKQTAGDECTKWGINAQYCESQADVINGINITNYEKLGKFSPDTFAGIVLDESSILKGFNGKMRSQLIEAFEYTPYKLACTATPSPNDYIELGNHCEFLNVMSRDEMLATFFVHDGKVSLTDEIWKLKNHGKIKFWEWLASWSVMFQKPSHLGFSDDNYQLPKLIEHELTIESGIVREGELFTMEARGLIEQRHAKRSTIDDRVKAAADLINASDEQWLVWCDLNDESAALAAAINDCVEVKGSDKDSHKENAAIDFAHGKIKVLVSKASIFGFGLNFQSCHNMLFVGLSNSFELTYQAVRRCYRFGQTQDVNVYYVAVDIEGAVLKNIQKKHRKFEEMQANIASHFLSAYHAITAKKDYDPTKAMTSPILEVKDGLCLDQKHGQNYSSFQGDCVELIKAVPDDSIGYSIFSPPFANLFTYSDSLHDMGNVTSDDQFTEHYKFLLSELYRVMMPGRLVSVHCQDLIATKTKDGFIGIKDFSGLMIQLMQELGFVYHSRVTIWKDPVCQMQRLKPIGLLHKQVEKDSSLSRQGLPDYLVTFRKPGENTEPIEGRLVEFYGEDLPPISNDPKWHSINVWQRYASPVWMDIVQNDTLNFREAKEDDDHKHICPLQLTVIRRALQLWSNHGDVVLSPFAGIGSEGYVSLDMDRKFVGFELKKSYWDCQVKNLEYIENKPKQLALSDLIAV